MALLLRLVLAVLLALGAAACGDGAAVEPVPPVGLDEVDVREGGWQDVRELVTEAAAEGRPTVVNLFASWCAPCAEELPLLVRAGEANPDVQFVGVSSEDPPLDRATEFVARQGVPWPVLYDPAASTHIALEGRVMPVTAVFDASGVLVEVVQGQLDEARLEQLLARARG